ncbi:MAG: 23S rRNA (adenine(2503)-C(2))-methyltransferase RlmN [Actinomycetota bacterium]|nr:23S rRNA (adenine(2503)-C(2))-methyltransferase RlmN [Actinomycetota bacterium]
MTSAAVAAPARVRHRSAYDLSFEELAVLLGDQPAYRARQVWDGLHRRGLRPVEMTDLPLALRARLEHALPAAAAEVSRTTADRGDTTKWLWELGDGRRVETVLMVYPGRVTVCVSTQAGCAMGCAFCATGQGGFDRQLSAGEIVEQVVAALRAARPRRVSNVVFMGMGEPLANYDRTWAAIERVHSELEISARRLTVSTVGLVPGIRRLALAPLPVKLAVSLHAANDALRDRLVPINRRYPLAALAEACAEYVEATGRRLSFEWALIEGTNDRAQDMSELAELARPLDAHVNLIPLNRTPGFPLRGSSRRRAAEAREELERLGVHATVRSTRGAEIDAACGQLAARGAARSGAPRAVRAAAVVGSPPVR